MQIKSSIKHSKKVKKHKKTEKGMKKSKRGKMIAKGNNCSKTLAHLCRLRM